jgi:hypothetical protein
MDNPWANGWSDEPEKPTFNDPEQNISTPSWTALHAHSSSLGGQEPDLSAPSWSTGAGMTWAEPSQTQGSLWSQTTDSGHLDAWGSSTYEGITLGRLTPELPSPQENNNREESPPVSPVPREDTPPVPSPVQEITITPPRTPSLTTQSPYWPPSPDVFGSFETGIDAESTGDPWSSLVSAFPPDTEEVDQWGSAWTAPRVEEETVEKVLPDEWEVARQRKENMDHQVVSIP